MPDLSVLERKLNKPDETRRDIKKSDIEAEHFSKMHENYEKLVYAPVNAIKEARTAAPAAPAAPAQTPASNYRQITEDYMRYEAHESFGTEFFEGVEYRDFALGTTEPVVEEPKIQPTLQTKVQTAVAANEASEEDALPTRRTMETIRRVEQTSVAEAVNTSFLSALTPRIKTALIAVAVAVVVAIILVMVNAGIIKSLDGRISLRESEIEYLEQQATEILSEIESISDPENIAQWAEEHGMTRMEATQS